MSHYILEFKNVSKSYRQGDGILHILKHTHLALEPGKVYGLMGVSGSGKTTLLNMAGLLDTPDEGDVIIDGTSTRGLKEHERTQMRGQRLGFVFQFHHLLQEFTAIENVMMPLNLQNVPGVNARLRAQTLLESLNMQQRQNHYPSQLSGGEQQRVAFARAFAHKPSLLLADEPTGNLDPETAQKVFNEIIRLVRQEGMTALIVTHDTKFMTAFDHIFTIEEGVLKTEHPH